MGKKELYDLLAKAKKKVNLLVSKNEDFKTINGESALKILNELKNTKHNEKVCLLYYVNINWKDMENDNSFYCNLQIGSINKLFIFQA